MRHLVLFIFVAVLWACKKEHKAAECRFSAIAYAGSTTKLPVAYSGDSVVKIGEGSYGYTLYYDQQKRLIRRDQPVLDPYYRWEPRYNSGGQVVELWFYSRQSNNWVSESRLEFTYNNGRIAAITEDNAASQGGQVYSHRITWHDNDIQSVEHQLNGQHLCATQFSYDLGKPNPMRSFSDFYYADGDANYVYYKLPYYFSEHLVTRQESTCPLSETRDFSYDLTNTGLVERMSGTTGVATGTIWVYEYECR